jgi:hypothetical protein
VSCLPLFSLHEATGIVEKVAKARERMPVWPCRRRGAAAAPASGNAALIVTGKACNRATLSILVGTIAQIDIYTFGDHATIQCIFLFYCIDFWGTKCFAR